MLSAGLLLGVLPAAWANGGMGMPSPPRQIMPPRMQTPEEQARGLYNDGVHYVKKADKAQAEAAQASDARRKDRAAQDAHQRYAEALAKFQQAVRLDPQLSEGWNYVGYTSRKLGNYDDALAAYDKALSLKPGYPDALEYRGEAYIALNRLPEAKQTYLELFAGNRTLADKLLTAMKGWVATRRTAPAGTDAASVDELDKWIQERATIASQTAALTRAGAAASWR
ncbi:MAG: tetratricopeptide repeat protein [Steroidobacteraceae bacterium]